MIVLMQNTSMPVLKSNLWAAPEAEVVAVGADVITLVTEELLVLEVVAGTELISLWIMDEVPEDGENDDKLRLVVDTIASLLLVPAHWSRRMVLVEYSVTLPDGVAVPIVA